MSSNQGPAVNIIAGQEATAGARKKLARMLGEIGVSSACWDPSVDYTSRPMALIRSAAGRPIVALIFLGEVPGAEFQVANPLLEVEFPKLKILKADPEHLGKVIEEVKNLLGFPTGTHQTLRNLLVALTGPFRHAPSPQK